MDLKCDYCHIKIDKVACNDCPYFAEEWDRRIKSSEYTYCIIFEMKAMKDCPGAYFDSEDGIYRCKHLDGNYSNALIWSKCPYKSPVMGCPSEYL